VLDFIVVEVLFRERTELDQGGLTRAKNAITCNYNLAQFTLRHQLYRYLTASSLGLTEVFNKLFECDASTATEEVRAIAEPVTKILADVCEALIGAVYVDSGGDLGMLEGVVREIMQLGGF
jgi:endoribonuclease Dicer